jgi:hypothetical protein
MYMILIGLVSNYQLSDDVMSVRLEKFEKYTVLPPLRNRNAKIQCETDARNTSASIDATFVSFSTQFSSLLLIVIETWLLKLFFLGLDDDDSS